MGGVSRRAGVRVRVCVRAQESVGVQSRQDKRLAREKKNYWADIFSLRNLDIRHCLLMSE